MLVFILVRAGLASMVVADGVLGGFLDVVPAAAGALDGSGAGPFAALVPVLG